MSNPNKALRDAMVESYRFAWSICGNSDDRNELLIELGRDIVALRRLEWTLHEDMPRFRDIDFLEESRKRGDNYQTSVPLTSTSFGRYLGDMWRELTRWARS